MQKLWIRLALLGFLAAGAASAQVCGETLFGQGFEFGDFSDWSGVFVGTGVPTPPTVERIGTLALRDPHVFIDAGIFGCIDVTDDVAVPGVDSINELIQADLNQDGDGDGCLDTSLLVALRPFTQTATGTETLDLRSGQCSSSTVCHPADGGVGSRTLYDTQSVVQCLDPLPATTSGYSPAVAPVDAPCLVSDLGTVQLAFLGDVPLTLQDARVAARFDQDDLVGGLLFGFLSEAEADAFILPADLPVVGGQALSSLFPGGTDNCAAGDDRDVHEGQSGWWLYFQFSAAAVPWTSL